MIKEKLNVKKPKGEDYSNEEKEKIISMVLLFQAKYLKRRHITF